MTTSKAYVRLFVRRIDFGDTEIRLFGSDASHGIRIKAASEPGKVPVLRTNKNRQRRREPTNRNYACLDPPQGLPPFEGENTNLSQSLTGG